MRVINKALIIWGITTGMIS